MFADKAEGSGVRCAVIGMLPAHRCTAGHRGLTWQLDQVAQGNSRCPARQTTAQYSRLVGGAQGGEIPAWDLLMCSLSNGWELRNSEPINRVNRPVNWDLGKPLTARIPRRILDCGIWASKLCYQLGALQMPITLELAFGGVCWSFSARVAMWVTIGRLYTNPPTDGLDSLCPWKCWLRNSEVEIHKDSGEGSWLINMLLTYLFLVFSFKIIF